MEDTPVTVISATILPVTVPSHHYKPTSSELSTNINTKNYLKSQSNQFQHMDPTPLQFHTHPKKERKNKTWLDDFSTSYNTYPFLNSDDQVAVLQFAWVFYFSFLMTLIFIGI